MTELEQTVNDLTALIGWAPFRPPTQTSEVPLSNPLVIQGLRKWVELMGVPYTRANGDATYKLAASWNNQGYLSKWAEGAQKDERTGRGGRGRARTYDWDGDDSKVEHTQWRQRVGADTVPTVPTVPTSARLDEASIVRAANSVIVPRLEEAKRELAASVQRNVLSAIDIALGNLDLEARVEETRNAIIESAVKAGTLAAREFMDSMTPRKIEIHNGEIKRLDAQPRHQVFDEVVRWLLLGENVYLVGNAGTGKTYLFRQIAEALGQAHTVLNPALTKYEFSGYLGPTGEYVTTLLRKAVEEGHLLCFDEYDMNAPGAIGFLNTLTANRFIAFPDAMVEAHPNFKVIAAANTYGRGPTMGFVGRNPMDAASLDRFVYVEQGYDEHMEMQIYGESAWLAYVHKVREAVERLQLKHIISMRAIERGLRGLRAGFEPERVCFAALWRGLPDDTIAKIKSIAGEFAPATVPERSESEGRGARARKTKLDAFKEAIENNEMVRAIRIWRSVTGDDLRYAKDRVEEIRDKVYPMVRYEDHARWANEYIEGFA